MARDALEDHALGNVSGSGSGVGRWWTAVRMMTTAAMAAEDGRQQRQHGRSEKQLWQQFIRVDSKGGGDDDGGRGSRW